MRKVQETLSRDDKLNAVDKDPSAIALKNKRLTFAWLDGEAQKVSVTYTYLFNIFLSYILFWSYMFFSV